MTASVAITYTPEGHALFNQLCEKGEVIDPSFAALAPPLPGDYVVLAGKSGKLIPFEVCRRSYDFSNPDGPVTWVVVQPVPDLDYTQFE